MYQAMAKLAAALTVFLTSASLALGQAGGGGGGGGGAGGGGGSGSAPQKPQPKPEKPATLEEMLAKALKDNPDIRVAESKVREAEAELNRVRLQVMQKIVALQRGLEAQRALIQEAEIRLAREEHLMRQGGANASDIGFARATLLKVKAQLAEMEAQVPYLLGSRPKELRQEQTLREIEVQTIDEYITALLRSRATVKSGTPELKGSMAERLRKALDTPVKVDYKNKSFHAILREFQKKMPGVAFQILLVEEAEGVNTDVGPPTTDLRLEEEVPLGAAFQLLGDTFYKWSHFGGVGDPVNVKEERIRFVVRDYGILVAGENRIPRGALLLHDFWKSEAGKPPLGALPEDSPPKDIKGTVKAVDSKNELVTISIGSDAGLQKGHTLEVYRLEPRPTYIGTLRILEVKPKEAVGKFTTRSNRSPVQVGDEVASEIMGRR